MPLQAAGDAPLKIGTSEVIAQIRQVIAETQVLSWLNSIPCNFGDAGAGVVKADEWCNLSTIFLPIALISMWGKGTQHPSPEAVAVFCCILDHTMLLVSAVSLACMQIMTARRSAAYLQYLTQYIHDFVLINANIKSLPNKGKCLSAETLLAQ